MQEFVPLRALVRKRMRNKSALLGVTDATVIKWARRMRRFLHLPGMVDEVYVRGLDRLPKREEHAPILAISHKKIHDVAALIVFMAGRPLERFHDLTYVAQGGLFSPLYTYRDLIPMFARRHLPRLSTSLARWAGRISERLFSGLHGYPVYREGKDVPPDEDAYESIYFGGTPLFQMIYEDFVKFAGRETRNSVIKVQRDLVEKNRTFVILPEGIYRHDGRVANLQDFLAVTAFRKQRSTTPIALGYDELCPDRLGRISAFIDVAAVQTPPAEKKEMAPFLENIRQILQDHTPITTTNLISLALKERGTQEFAWHLLESDVSDLAKLTTGSPFSYDPGLAKADYLSQKLQRFRKRFGKAWFSWQKGNARLRPIAAETFADSERTCNDILWNCNTVVHLEEYLGK